MALSFSLIGELIQGAHFSLRETIIFGYAFRLLISECYFWFVVVPSVQNFSKNPADK